MLRHILFHLSCLLEQKHRAVVRSSPSPIHRSCRNSVIRQTSLDKAWFVRAEADFTFSVLFDVDVSLDRTVDSYCGADNRHCSSKHKRVFESGPITISKVAPMANSRSRVDALETTRAVPICWFSPACQKAIASLDYAGNALTNYASKNHSKYSTRFFAVDSRSTRCNPCDSSDSA